MSQRKSSPIFVGRRPELERLEGALEAAASGRPSLVLVAGEAGVGKTRLLAELSREAHARGTRTLAGGCLDLGGVGLPFAPFAEALKALLKELGRESEADVAAVLGPSEHALSGLVPDLNKFVPADSPPLDLEDQARRRASLFDAVTDVLGRLCAVSPVLLILEDLHWADGSTRDLLRFLMRNVGDERLLIVGTFRSDDLHRRHPLMRLLSELERSNRVDRLDMTPFGREEIVEQATAILGHQPPPEIVDRVMLRSDGLPFYVEELLAADAAGDVLPGSLHDIVGLSLAALPEGSVSLVRAAAVIGGRFTLDRLAVVAGLDDVALLPSLRGAIEASVLVSDDRMGKTTYGFRHALLREAAYDELLPSERTRFHARLADYLEAALASTADAEPALLADLAIQTYRSGDQPRALAAAVGAVRALAEACAFREALEHAGHALELWPHVVDAEARAGISHGELLALAGQVGASSGVTGPALEHAKAALGELESSASPERLAALLIDIYNIAFAAEAFDTAWITARRLHGLVDELHASRLQVDALIVVADERWSTGHLREALGLDERAMETARTLNDDRAWAVSACERAAGLATGGRTGEAEALVDTAAALYPGFDGSARTFASAISSCWVLLMTGRFEDSVRLAADARRAAIRYGVERRQGRWFQANEAHALFELGRLDEAARLARSAGEHRYLGTWTVIAKIEAVRGRFDAAREALRTDDLWNGALWRLETETFIERAAGNFDGVRAGIDQAEAERRTSELVAPVWPLLGTGVGAAADHALMARRRRRRAAAAEAVGLGRDWLGRLREIVEHGRANGGAGRFCEATLATAEGEMERLEERFDPATWSNAARQWRALSHPYGTAHAELRLSEVLLELDADRDEVARLLRGAYGATITLGAVPLRREIETVARQAKITIAPEPAVPADGSAGPPATEVARSLLTARERDVLRLVAEGHTNREIGDRLFISEKTASVHVSNAMSKLGALSRYEAAAAAERTGQLS